MKVVVAGGRDFTDYELLRSKLDYFFSKKKPEAIICGDATGADALGARYAEEHGIPVQHFPADWKREGRGAGPKRNARMAETADAVVVFWDGLSRGTKNMIECAKARGLPIRIVKY